MCCHVTNFENRKIKNHFSTSEKEKKMSSSESETVKRTIDDVDDVEDRDTALKRPNTTPQWKIDLNDIKPENVSPLAKFGGSGVMASYIKEKGPKGNFRKCVFELCPGLVTRSNKGTLEPHLAGLGYSENGDLKMAKHILSLVWGLPLPADLKEKSPGLEAEHQEAIAEVKALTQRLFRMLFDNEEDESKGPIQDARHEFQKTYANWGRSFTLLSKKELMDALTANGHDKAEANTLINESGVLSNSEPDEFTNEEALDIIYELTHVLNEQKKEQIVHDNAFKTWLGKCYNLGFITEKEGRQVMYIQFESFSSFNDKKKEPSAKEDMGNAKLQEVFDVIGPWSGRSLINVPEYRGPDGKALIDPETKKPFNDLMKITPDMDTKYLGEEVLKVGDLVGLKFAIRLSLNSQGKAVKPEPYFNSIVLHKRSEDAARVAGEGTVHVSDYGFGGEDPFAGGDTF